MEGRDDIGLFDRYWAIVPNKVNKKEAKKEFEKALKEIIADEDYKAQTDKEGAQVIILALEAQKRYKQDAKDAGEFVPNFPEPNRWLKKGRYRDEIPSHYKLKEKRQTRELKKCSKCNRPVHGPQFTECTFHVEPCESERYPTYTELMREKYREMDLIKKPEETNQQWMERLRKARKDAARKIGENIQTLRD